MDRRTLALLNNCSPAFEEFSDLYLVRFQLQNLGPTCQCISLLCVCFDVPVFGFHVQSYQSVVPVGFKLDLELRTDLLNIKTKEDHKARNCVAFFFNNMCEASLSRWTLHTQNYTLALHKIQICGMCYQKRIFYGLRLACAPFFF